MEKINEPMKGRTAEIATIQELKLTAKHMKPEPNACNGKERYSHPAFTRKIVMGWEPASYDQDKKLVEIKACGSSYWLTLDNFFGIAVTEATFLFILYEDGTLEDISIVDVQCFKVKKTNYWKLIFERDLPF